VKLKNPNNPKERNLLKGAIRRLFSRSETRKAALAKSAVDYSDNLRPRVKKWSQCPECLNFTPTYLMEVDHVFPIIAVHETLDVLSWDQVVDRIFCDPNNLRALCKGCHKIKTKAENAERRKYRKEKMK
jgi:5-methylcytosine-specific restriction endonuclease McrA